MSDPRYIRKTARYNGKKYEATGKTEREASQKLAEKLAAAKRGEEQRGANMTVDTWFNEWLETYKEPKGISSVTLNRYRTRYRDYIQPAIGKMKLRDVREHHLQRIMNGLADMSKSHCEKICCILQGMFARARQSRLIVFDPAEGIELPRYYEGKRRSATDEERARILATVGDHPHGLWVLTMLCTGMRPGESAALKWSSVDFTHNEIHVTTARATGTQDTKGPKTAAGVRDIPIPAQLRPALLAARGDPFSLVFPDANGKIARDGTMRAWWTSFRKAAGLPEDLTPYCMRHTYCTDLQKAGVDLRVAKSLMGHSNISVTADIYTHVEQKSLQDAVCKLNQLAAFSGGNPGGKAAGQS